jgi:hypothetical protein
VLLRDETRYHKDKGERNAWRIRTNYYYCSNPNQQTVPYKVLIVGDEPDIACLKNGFRTATSVSGDYV